MTSAFRTWRIRVGAARTGWARRGWRLGDQLSRKILQTAGSTWGWGGEQASGQGKQLISSVGRRSEVQLGYECLKEGVAVDINCLDQKEVKWDVSDLGELRATSGNR